ncbi:LuxR C-terminal-related transcriptional regulator [Pseudoteredinibacter isoporae]|uniref:LuxR C-terminal-related transcriptional regulator n=1 Tax=Pseudoteredinibacter isoporae TaxID=570281 RepID=UPI0033419831
MLQCLQSQLNSATQLVLFTAPAGFGKTSSISQWLDEFDERTQIAWLQLDSADRESKALLANIILALAEAGCDMCELELAARQGALDAPNRVVISAIVAKLDDCLEDKQRLFLILDDYHLVDNEAVNSCIDLLLQLASPKLCLILSCRYRPELKISKLRLQGRIIELGDDILRFLPSEIDCLFGESFPPEFQQLLIDKTQGWVAMLQLAKIWGQPALLEHFDGAVDGLAEYMTEQVIADHTDDEQQFLLDTSVLEQVSVDLADYIRASNDSHYYFHRLVRLTPLVSNSGGILRYHPLLRDFLQRRLQHQNPERWQNKSQKAAEWFENQGDILNAVRLYTQASSYEEAYQSFSRVGGWQIMTSLGHQLMGQLLSYFPAQWLDKKADLVLFNAYLSIKQGELSKAQALFQRVLRQQGADIEASAALPLNSDLGMVSLILSLYADEEVDQLTLNRLEEALASIGRDETDVEAVLLSGQFLCEYYLGNITRSINLAKRAIQTLQALELPYAQDYFYLHLANGQMYMLELEECRANIEQGIQFAEENFGKLGNLTAAGQVVLAQSHYMANEIEKAQTLLDKALPTVCDGDSWHEILVPALTTAMQCAAERGGKEELQNVFESGVTLAKQRKLSRLQESLTITHAEILCRLGDIEDAADWMSNIEIKDYSTAFYWQLEAQRCLCRCRYWFIKGELSQAKSCLQNWESFRQRFSLEKLPLLELQYSIWNGLLDFEMSEGVDARQALFHHLNEHWLKMLSNLNLRLVLEVGEPIVPLLRGCLQQAKHSMLSSRYSQLLKHIISKIAINDVAGELFSTRELEVLRSLAQGNVNKRIARELDMTENTVKFHLKKIYKKLGVDKRIAAVNEARRLELL